jgi:hypothetical protein
MSFRIALLAMLLVGQTAFAQGYGMSADPKAAADRSAMLKSLDRGKRMKGSRDEYQYLPQVFAVARSSSSETPEQAIARVAQGAELIETKGRLVLYRAAGAGGALVQRSGDSAVYPTAINTRTGALGVLTGELVVKPKNISDADAIASGHGMEKVKAYPQLGTVFYKVKAGADIADVSAAVQADPRVESAYPEVVERVRVPR